MLYITEFVEGYYYYYYYHHHHHLNSFMQGIYTYIYETNHVPREHRVAAILVLLFMVLISLVPALAPLYLYFNTFYVVIIISSSSSSSSSSNSISISIDNLTCQQLSAGKPLPIPDWQRD
jgi:hypothetical protein